MSQEPLESFVHKWRARWPEWGIAETFVPPAQRAPALAWFALLQELQEAAWAGAEPAPGLAKLAWWQEELRGWSRGARRHPLGQALQRIDAGWEALGLALAALPSTREPDSGDDGRAGLRTYAAAALACEQRLFGGPEAAADTVEAFVDGLRIERALSRGELEAALALRPALEAPAGRALARPRRLRRALLRERLRTLAADPPPAGGEGPGAGAGRRVSPLRILWSAWRAARPGNASLQGQAPADR